MVPFTIILKTLAKKISMNLITSSFISTTMILILIIGSASVVRRLNIKTEVIRTLVNIFNSGVNPYSDQLRTMGEVEDFSDYHIEFNLDQRLDQRTYNKPLTSEVAAVWIEGSEHRGQFENSVVLHGKDRSWKGIWSYHGCYDPLSYPLFFSRGEFGWHNCIPKVVTEAQVNRARAIRKQRAQGGGDDEAGNCIFPLNKYDPITAHHDTN
jgi:hypothetical protein